MLGEILDDWLGTWSPQTPAADPDALREWQLAHAWEQVERVARDNPYYAAQLTLPELRTAEAFGTLPLTYKQDIVADCIAEPPYGTRTTAAGTEIRQVVETSGTSGKGREVYALDADDRDAVYRAEALGFWWAGVRPGTPVLLTLPVAMSAAGLWYQGALNLIGANLLSVGSYPTHKKVDLLQRYRAEVVIGTPSYIDRLAALCAEQEVDPGSIGVRSILVAGEPYTVAWASRVEATWQAKLFEQYGCTERQFAWACPDGALTPDGGRGVLHFPPELTYWEVIDPDSGRPAEDGEFGELIVTPLVATASPLVRYATRDKVQFVAAGSCPCGRPLPGIRAGGVARYDNMMKIRGVNVWPENFDTALFAIPEVLDYRGVVRSAEGTSDHIEIRVELSDSAAAVCDRVCAQVERVTGLRPAVTVLEAGEIAAATPTGFVKLSRWTDQRRR
jgi:phenylacetate-CoA ligase